MRYGSSKWRIGLFVVLIGVIMVSVSVSLAQGTAVPPAEEEPPGRFAIVAGLIIRHLDFIFYTIFALSIIAVALIIKSLMQVRAGVMYPEASTQAMRRMISNRQFAELLAFTEKDESFVSKSLYPALKRAPDFTAMKEALETAAGEQAAEQFRKIEYLNIIGNLGPLLGLLGTVLGMIDAFAALSRAGAAANPSDLSYGISLALTSTMMGLLLAVPCLGAFGVLRTMVDRLTIRASLIAEDLLLSIKPQQSTDEAPLITSPAR